MFIDLTEDQYRLRQELRTYFADLVPPDLRRQFERSGVGGPEYRRVVKQLGSDGWLGIGWPTAYGGQGRGALEQLVFFDEANRAGVPLPLVTLNTVGPTLAEFGTEAQKDRFLPAILAGEVHFAIGYTEPQAGTDLASLETRAVRDGDHYVVNGQKVFTTGGHDADFVWLACRTDPDAPRHRGISILIVDTTDPGYSWTPIYTLGTGHHTNATYYEDVVVPVSLRVGEEHTGWQLITTQLNFERVALGPEGKIARAFEPVLEWARTTEAPDGRRVIDHEWVRVHLARVRAKLEAAKLFNWRVASRMAAGTLNAGEASALKVYGSELTIEVLRLLMEVVGAAAGVKDGPGAALAGSLDSLYKSALVPTFGGGVNEVQREIVATAALGLPRAARRTGS